VILCLQPIRYQAQQIFENVMQCHLEASAGNSSEIMIYTGNLHIMIALVIVDNKWMGYILYGLNPQNTKKKQHFNCTEAPT
jgi:hypothetical protein